MSGDVNPSERLSGYYRSEGVRARMAEYCGAAWSLAGYGGRHGLHEPDGAPVSVPNSAFDALLDQGADLCRSLADRNGVLLLLDVDYTNARDRAEPYRNAELCFARLEPVYTTVLGFFARYGIEPLTLMTGRGYHFTLRVPRGSPFHSGIVDIGSPPASLRARYEAPSAPNEAPTLGKAHDGAGRLLEHLAHEVVRGLRGRAEVPVTLADVPPAGGGPFVCMDLTAYADPLFARHARCAFSGNQKAHLTRIAPERPFVITLPRESGVPVADLLRERQDPERASARAARVGSRIPDVASDGGWVRDYRGGLLGQFHRKFDEGPVMPPRAWPYTYDSLDLLTLPACAREALQSPNPALLMPVHLRTVALALWGIGWHPRSAAALIRSRYEKEFGWGGLWARYDAAARAEYYVRVFCGAIAAGLEDPATFTCASQVERGVCPWGGCRWDLSRLRPAMR